MIKSCQAVTQLPRSKIAQPNREQIMSCDIFDIIYVL